jgi:hypothetical protein
MAMLGLFLVQIGFVGFVASLFCAVWKGLNRDGKAQPVLKWWLLCALACFVLWVIGLRTYPAPLP